MATSDAPLNVPNVTLSVAKKAPSAQPVSNADFSYFENFDGLTKGSKFGEAYNKSVTEASPVIFTSWVPIVSTDDPILALPDPVPPAPSNPKVDAANPAAGRTGDSVNSALRFTFEATLIDAVDNDAWSEQPFSLNPAFLDGAPGLTDIWIQYDQFIPPNYTHRDSYAPDGYWTDGRKVFALFGDGYSAPYPTYIIGAIHGVYDGALVDGSYGTNAFLYTDASGVRKNMGREGYPNKRLIIDPRIEKGHWQRRTIHVKIPTSATANDGVTEFWVQRLAETANPVIEKQFEVFDGEFYDPIRPYINKGYILGYSNDGYSEQTTMLVTNFILSSSVNDIDQLAIN